MNELLSQLTSAAIVTYGLEALKRARWFPWLTMETSRANRIVAAIGAAASAIGVHFAYDPTVGSLVITGLTATGLLHGAWHWLNAMAIQQLAYDSVIRPNQPLVTAVTSTAAPMNTMPSLPLGGGQK